MRRTAYLILNSTPCLTLKISIINNFLNAVKKYTGLLCEYQTQHKFCDYRSYLTKIEKIFSMQVGNFAILHRNLGAFCTFICIEKITFYIV